MEVVGRDHVLLILRSRFAYDLEAKAFCNELELYEKHPEKCKEYQQLRSHFGMPDTEQILASTEISRNYLIFLKEITACCQIRRKWESYLLLQMEYILTLQ
jgi:hypothetical protein